MPVAIEWRETLGQILLIICALTLLANLQLSVNSALYRSALANYDGEATIDAISIGQAMVDEILTKDFDKNTISVLIYDSTQLTGVNSLGKDAGETVSAWELSPFQSQVRFNDVDDYKGYTRIVSTPRLGDFKVQDSVYYVLATNFNAKATTQTWYKKIVVTVTHPSMLVPVKVKSLAVYRRYF